MEENKAHKCRACFKNDTKTFLLSKYARGCCPRKTYGQLLNKFASIEFIAEQERNLTQHLCFLCCRQLRNIYAFAKQAQYCNKKLIHIMNRKKMDCLKEQTIDLPAFELDKSVNIKLEKERENDDLSTDEGDTQELTDGIDIKNEEHNETANLFLKNEYFENVEDNETNNAAIEECREMEDDNEINNQNQSNYISIECATTSENTWTPSINETKKYAVANNDNVSCPICYKLVKHDNLIKHMRIQHDIKVPSKLLLKQNLSRKENFIRQTSSFKRNTILMNNKIYKCQSCDYTANSQSALHYHNEYKHGSKVEKFKCNFCKYVCLKKINLLAHVKKEHKTLIEILKEDMMESNTESNTKQSKDDVSIECPTKSEHNITNLNVSTQIQDVKVPCPICNKLISRRDNLIKHMRILHDIKAPNKLLLKQKPEPKEQIFACVKCPCKYTNKYKYLNHLLDKHGINQKTSNKREKFQIENKVIKCRSCDYTAKTYAALHYHNRSKHGTEEDKFKCKFCTYMCLKKFDLLLHVKNVHKSLIKTLKADMENKTEQSETLNANTNLQDPFMTAQPDTLSEDDSSDDNIPLVHKTRKLQDTTTNDLMDMDKEESSDEEFIRSILDIKKRQPKAVSTKALARRCDECGNIYKNHQALYAHQRHVHISEDKYSLCPHCGKKYKRKADLRNHIEKAHTVKDDTPVVKQPPKVREKRFMCTECSYVCSTITILKIHINRHHTGEKPHKCDLCSMSFIVPYDLKVHRYLHTGERPYKCPICSKGFRDNSHMIKHKRIHSGERPFKCKECGKGFTQSYNLSVHKRTHLKEKKLNCTICGKFFESKSFLNIHRINENHHDEAV